MLFILVEKIRDICSSYKPNRKRNDTVMALFIHNNKIGFLYTWLTSSVSYSSTIYNMALFLLVFLCHKPCFLFWSHDSRANRSHGYVPSCFLVSQALFVILITWLTSKLIRKQEETRDSGLAAVFLCHMYSAKAKR